MALWSTRRPDHRNPEYHLMEDQFGRPTTPPCGLSTEGLWFCQGISWEQAPEHQRCTECGRASKHR